MSPTGSALSAGNQLKTLRHQGRLFPFSKTLDLGINVMSRSFNLISAGMSNLLATFMTNVAIRQDDDGSILITGQPLMENQNGH